MSLQDAANLVNISVEDIRIFQKREENIKDLQKDKKLIAKKQTGDKISDILSNNQVIELLTEIRDYLKILAEK